MSHRSLHPTHPTNVAVRETDRHVDFTPTCGCSWRGSTVRLGLPYRPHQRIAAYADAVHLLREHEHANGIVD